MVKKLNLNIDVNWLYDIYVNKGISGNNIAKELNCSKHTVYRLLEKNNIKKRIRTSKYLLLNDTEWLLEQYKDKSIRQIAMEFGMSVGTVYSALKSRGVEIRNEKESLKLRYPEGRNGYLSSNWKDGRSKIAHNIRTSSRYKEWRRQILERDNYTCVNCGRCGKEVDHIKQLVQILQENDIKNRTQANNCEELWDINNGRTMCHRCHVNTPTHSRSIKKLKN